MNSRMIKDFSGNISYKNDSERLHRDNGPALILINGTEIWYQNGKLHREDGPAFVNGNIERFYLNHVCLEKETWKNQILIKKLEILTEN